MRGALAIAGVFLVTLVAAAADSYIGLGLGMITLVALTAGTIGAALVTRRSDLLSVLVAPPLVFVAVALLNIGLAPSASLNLPTLATLLVRGFPAMGLATGVALVITLGRLAARR
jgi:NADH:ubiquinone oxidoreductase subunit K